MHDLIIRNAQIIDGSGSPLQQGDLAVDGEQITALGQGLGQGREEIDADGLALAPGIIDLHTHYDAQLTWDAFATPSTGLGVTTTLIGNCGFTIAPCRPKHRELTLRNLTHVEGMSLDALMTGIDWDFESYPEYLDCLERKGVVPNVASYCGHSSLRTWVLGDEASDRAATPDEVAQMKSILLEALNAGAVGLATSTLEQHNGENGIPMPSRLADEHEMLELTGALGEAGRGVFMLTKGMTTSIPFLEKISANNNRPVMIAAMFVDPNDPERVFREFGEIEDARSRGRELWGQVGCFPLGMEFTIRHPYPLEAFLAWRPAIEAGGESDYVRILADASFRESIKAEARTKGVPNRFSYHQFDHLTVMTVVDPGHQDRVGKTVGQLALDSGKDPFDWLLDFALDGEMDAMFDCKLFNTQEDRVKNLLQHPNAAVTLSDAGAHLSFLCDAGFGLHLFGHWVRDRGDLTLEHAVASVTSRPADICRISDRGRLVSGHKADLMLFDPETVGRGPRRRVNDLPGGNSRVDTPAVGLHGVWVNGRRVVDPAGLLADCGTPGCVLRDFSEPG
ncbi:MAG: amidohydrolase family protein [Pseudomonadota bacterium]|nr:amidohydrolase family protein [Pseudomonadota bacterium]MED5407945.1 amidohydrolase family protein [Pseudomonadota bacterium]